MAIENSRVNTTGLCYTKQDTQPWKNARRFSIVFG